MTDRAAYRFIVKDGGGGQPWTMAERQGSDMPILQGGVLGFDLMGGTPLADAQLFADDLNQHIVALATRRSTRIDSWSSARRLPLILTAHR